MDIEITEEGYDFLKILFSVLMGMFGKSFFDYLKKLRENKKDKTFIIDYLKSTEKIFPLLNSEYNKVKQFINDDAPGRVLQVKLFEDFNTKVLSSITFPNYYKLFKKKAFLIYDVYHIVNTIEKDLPREIGQRYFEAQKKHYYNLEENNLKNHSVKTCRNCNHQKDLINQLIGLKLKELDILKNKITLILNR